MTQNHTPPTEPSPADRRRETERRRDENLARIRRVLAVMSGKGGVGKSTIAAALAVGLARRGLKTGLLDVDFHGPTIPTLLGIRDRRPASDGESLQPVDLGPNLRTMSLALLLQAGDEAVIWRGPMKIGVINQLLGDVQWGDLDCLVIDCPPGTGDEPLSLAQVIPMAEVVMVGTPQEVAMADVRKAITFCRKLGLHLAGLVETMGSMLCPECGADVPLFRRRDASRPEGVPLLAEIPFDPGLQAACDDGRLAAFLQEETPTAARLLALADAVASATPQTQTPDNETAEPKQGGPDTMRFAIPTADGALAMHFGHADQFAIVDADDGRITGTQFLTPPSHAPGVLPAWLKQNQVNTIIAGGMGSRAQGLFAASGIAVVVGAPTAPADELVRQFLAGDLATGENVCDH